MNPPCTVPDCTSPARGNQEWCELHYRRARKFGDPTHISPLVAKRRQIALFWEEVGLSAAREDGPCIEWPGARNRGGYGRSNNHRSGESLVSRITWHLTFGPIPDGLWVLHRCDNPPCARPAHLFLGTNADNMQDMVNKNRQSRLAGNRNARTIIPDSMVIELRQRWLTGETCKSLAAEVGVHPSTISVICRGLRRTTATPIDPTLVRRVHAAPRRILTRRPRELTPLEVEVRRAAQAERDAQTQDMIHRYSDGQTTTQIGAAVGLNHGTVYRRLAAAGVKFRTPADYHGTPDVAEMARLYRAGAGLHALAKNFRSTSMRVADLLRAEGVTIRRPGRPSVRGAA